MHKSTLMDYAGGLQRCASLRSGADGEAREPSAQCMMMQRTELHMSPVNIRTAARLARRDRSTLTRMIERGKLSATRDESGRYLIDPAELERVFGKLSLHNAHVDAEVDAVHETALAYNALARELEVMRELLQAERTMHERERSAWDDERTFLRKLVEEHAGTVKLLTDERQKARKPRRWWRWGGS